MGGYDDVQQSVFIKFVQKIFPEFKNRTNEMVALFKEFTKEDQVKSF